MIDSWLNRCVGRVIRLRVTVFSKGSKGVCGARGGQPREVCRS